MKGPFLTPTAMKGPFLTLAATKGPFLTHPRPANRA